MKIRNQYNKMSLKNERKTVKDLPICTANEISIANKNFSDFS